MLTISKLMTYLLLLTAAASSMAKPTAVEEAAKKEGIILYNQYKPATAQLLIAANAGDSDAQFYLGNAIRNSKKYITADAFKWYKASADQGNFYAMFQLARATDELCATMENCQTDKKLQTIGSPP